MLSLLLNDFNLVKAAGHLLAAFMSRLARCFLYWFRCPILRQMLLVNDGTQYI